MAKKGGQTQTVTQRLDPQSQRYVNQMRNYAGQGAGALAGSQNPLFIGPPGQSPADMAAPFMNSYNQSVIDATRGEFDHLRNQAGLDANQMATQQGAFGGSRHAVMQGSRLGELDRAQASQIAQMQHTGYNNALQQGMQFSEYNRALQERMAQEPLFRQQQILQMMNLGMGPTGGSTSTQMPPGSWLGTMFGGGMAGSAFNAAQGTPWGTIAGAGLGLLGGLFG